MTQFLAAAITVAAVLVMLAPLRSGPAGMQSRQAGFIPLFSATGVADGAAFHRLSISAAAQYASAEPLSRAPVK